MGTDPGRDLVPAEFEIRIAEKECEDLAPLLGAQDGQERRIGPSIHYSQLIGRMASASLLPLSFYQRFEALMRS
jgi:hypothetical protein